MSTSDKGMGITRIEQRKVEVKTEEVDKMVVILLIIGGIILFLILLFIGLYKLAKKMKKE